MSFFNKRNKDKEIEKVKNEYFKENCFEEKEENINKHFTQRFLFALFLLCSIIDLWNYVII